MAPEFHRANAIFETVRDLDPDARRRKIDAACEDDTGLRRAVESMLRHDGSAHALLDAPVADLEALAREGNAVIETDRRGEMIGGYCVLDTVGAGGMGVVYRAEQVDPRRTVALKLVNPLLTSPRGMQRLRSEAAILARLEHPGIARIYQAGLHETGGQRVPFIAMEFIAGEPITTYVERAARDVHDRVCLLVELADAVAHAHERGVIHRDLKPANVLVTANGRVKVLDFGASRLLTREAALTRVTEAGELIGTVPYMSPEQFGFDPEAVGTVTDVYALGVIAYRVLCGRMPLDVSGCPLAEAARIVQRDEPTRLGRHDRRLRGDLETIVATALEKDPRRRYPDAAALRDDLQRYLAHETIAARPPSALYRAAKFADRHRGPVIGVLVAMVALVVAVIVSTGLFLDADRLRGVAEREAVDANLSAAEALIRAGDVGAARERLARVPDTGRTWPWRHLDARCDESAAVLEAGGVGALTVALSRDDRRLAWGTDAGRVHVLDRETGRRWTSEPADSQVRHVTFSPDGAVIAGTGIDTTRLWDVTAGGLAPRAPVTAASGRTALLASDGRRLFTTGSIPGRLTVHDLVAGTARDITEGAPNNVRVDGPRAGHIAECTQTRLRVLREDDLTEVARWNLEPAVWAVALAPDGRRIAVGNTEGVVTVYEVGMADSVARARLHSDAVHAVAFAAEGRVVSGSRDYGVAVWDPSGARPTRRLHGHAHHVLGATVTRDGRTVFSASLDGTVRQWDVDEPSNPIAWPYPTALAEVAFNRAGNLVAVGAGRHLDYDGRVRTIDARDGTIVRTFEPALQEVYHIGFAADDRLVASGSGNLAVWDPSDPRPLLVLEGLASGALAIAPDRVALPTAEHDAIVVVDPRRAVERRRIPATTAELAFLGWTTSGALLGVEREGDILSIDAASGAVRRRAHCDCRRVEAADLGPDGRLAIGCESGRIVIAELDVDPPRLRAVTTPSARVVRDVLWTTDGAWLVSAGEDRRLEFRDPETARLRFALGGHERPIRAIAHAAASGRFASVSANMLHIWHLGARAGHDERP